MDALASCRGVGEGRYNHLVGLRAGIRTPSLSFWKSPVNTASEYGKVTVETHHRWGLSPPTLKKKGPRQGTLPSGSMRHNPIYFRLHWEQGPALPEAA